ncbi:hypothetical protein [Nitratiruptor tergarcus]|uniref:Uncharacterized protein n=1 Tax=Nitratiruptor tergarcus DSM 16512 TaxID=1069081 RepID=A0A1W1WVC6_9BACT|nr:hypothetical protein [Nitratiruptor tergarcus]SMC10165.1 hypothetical protein SAMN05660197_2007 [Nitratiruptor tergarcus DSM 16512]
MRYVTFLLFTALFWGCATKIPSYQNIKINKAYFQGSSKEKKLVSAFANYWQARIKGDYKTSFSYELPYQQYIKDFNKYKELIGGIYKGTTITLKNIKYSHPNIAIVTRVVKIGKNLYPRKDKWIYIDGKWYHKFYQTILPPRNPEDADFQ